MQQYNQPPGQQYPYPQPPVRRGYGPAIAWLVAWFITHGITVFLFVTVIGIPLAILTFILGIIFLILAFVAFMRA